MRRWMVAPAAVLLLMVTATGGHAQSGSMSGDKTGDAKMGDKK